MPPSQHPISILFEHDDFVITDKPNGVMMHDCEKGIITLMRIQYPQHNWHLIHRLDTATSGCLLLAKHGDSAAALSQLFANRQIEKYYLALSDKKPKKKQGLIKGDMEKARNGSMKLSKTMNNPAITQFFSCAHTQGIRALMCKPHTGKTHQIRVALKSQGAPILGDKRYGGTQACKMYLRSIGMRFRYQNQLIEFIDLGESDELFDTKLLPSEWLHPWDLPWPSL